MFIATVFNELAIFTKMLSYGSNGATKVQKFVTHCNSNSLGISFTYVQNSDTLAFLDLESSNIFAKYYTKPTADKLYLNFHHPL